MSASARVNVPSPHPRLAQIVGPSASTPLSASMSIASRNRIAALPSKYAPMCVVTMLAKQRRHQAVHLQRVQVPPR